MIRVRCANGVEWAVKNVYQGETYYEGVARPTLRFEIDPDVIPHQDDVESLTTGPITLLDIENGNILGIHEGYGHLGLYEISLMKVQPMERTVKELKDKIASLEYKNQQDMEAATKDKEQAILNLRTQFNGMMEKAMAEITDKARQSIQETIYEHERQVNRINEEHQMDMEALIAFARTQGMRAPTKDDAWDPEMIYLKDDTIKGYVSLCVNRGYEPEANLGTRWIRHYDVENAPRWEDAKYKTKMCEGTFHSFNGELYLCINDHYKSKALAPNVATNKWQKL